MNTMKKIYLLAVFAVLGIASQAQTTAGDLYFGAQGQYVTSYKNVTAGVRGAYHFTDPFQLNLAFSMNPWITFEEGNNSKFDAKVYSVDLNGHYYVINKESWGMAPVVGVGYYYGKETRTEGVGSYDGGTYNKIGLNLGWDIRYEFAMNWRVSGYWKYTMLNEDYSHHTFGVGVGYHFNVF